MFGLMKVVLLRHNSIFLVHVVENMRNGVNQLGLIRKGIALSLILSQNKTLSSVKESCLTYS